MENDKSFTRGGISVKSYYSLTFFLAFLPLLILIYSITPKKKRWLILLLASYIFFYLLSGKLLVYLLASTIIIYLSGLLIKKINTKCEERIKDLEKEEKKKIKAKFQNKKKLVLLISILINVGILIFLKYAGFFATNINSLFKIFDINYYIPVPKFLLPIGISFYTLQGLSYIIDVYRGSIEADNNIGRLALFLAFFPQIMEGPICRYNETALDLYEGKSITYHNFTFGLERIFYGILKKCVIADRLNPLITNIFTNYNNFNGGIILLGAIAYTIQLYMEFSGTMDIVIGVAEIFGIKLPENFKRPFASHTISEFWKRWHITLGTWFKDYIFYPISVSSPFRKLTLNLRKKLGNYYGPVLAGVVALFTVWLLNGFWHGVGWQYILFGLYHFCLILIGSLISPLIKKITDKLHINRNSKTYHIIQIIKVCFLVFIGELIFRAEGLDACMSMLNTLFTNFSLSSFKDLTFLKLGIDKADFIIVGITLIIIFIISHMEEKKINVRELISKQNIIIRWVIYYAFILFIIIFGAYGYGYVPVDPIYAQF